MRPSSPAGIGRIRLDEPRGSPSARYAGNGGRASELLRDSLSGCEAGGALGGTGAEAFVFLLPGNPVSCLCAYEFFAGPTIRALGGRTRAWPHRRVRLPLARKIASQVGRVDYVRVAIEDGRVVPIATSGASILSSTVRADGCVLVPRSLEGMPEGAEVEVLLYDAEPRP